MLRTILMGWLVIAASASASELTFAENSVIARGITPRGQVVWYGLAIQPLGFENRFVNIIDLQTDLDGDGVVMLNQERLQTRSVWTAVDLSTGDILGGAPAGSRAQFRSLLPDSIPQGQAKKIIRQSAFAHLLVVRPGVGAWTLTAGDGGASDEDSIHDGKITNSLSQFHPIASSGPPPQQLKKGDAVIAIDPETLVVYTARVAD